MPNAPSTFLRFDIFCCSWPGQGSNWVTVVGAEKRGRDSCHKGTFGIKHLSKDAFTHLTLNFMMYKLGMQ